MEREDIQDKLDNIKEDYKYDIKGERMFEFPGILLLQFELFMTRIERTNIENDYIELREKIQKNKEGKINEEVEKELEQIINEYNIIKEGVDKEYTYYFYILYDLAFSFYENKNCYKVKGAKEAFINTSKSIIDSNILNFINKEKKIIQLRDKIKDFKKLFF